MLWLFSGGDWKLGGVELIFDVNYPAPTKTRQNITKILPSQYRPMEIDKGD